MPAPASTECPSFWMQLRPTVSLLRGKIRKCYLLIRFLKWFYLSAYPLEGYLQSANFVGIRHSYHTLGTPGWVKPVPDSCCPLTAHLLRDLAARMKETVMATGFCGGESLR